MLQSIDSPSPSWAPPFCCLIQKGDKQTDLENQFRYAAAAGMRPGNTDPLGSFRMMHAISMHANVKFSAYIGARTQFMKYLE